MTSRYKLHLASYATLSLLAACSTHNKYYDAAKPHHRPNGFANTEMEATGSRTSLFEVLWRNIRGDFRPAAEPVGGYVKFVENWVVPLDPMALSKPSDVSRITWLGHASVLLQVNGSNVITDPIFGDRAGPMSLLGAKRRVPSPIQAQQLPPIDAILISHNHYDHLDYQTVRDIFVAQGDKPLWLVPLGVKAWFTEQGISNVREMDWWEHVDHAGLRFHFTPCQHWSKRTPWDTNQTLWGSFMVERPARANQSAWRFLYTGDTGYSGDFAEIRRRLGPVDLLAVPIGAYEPRDFMAPQHVNPDEAVRIAKDLEAKQSVGVHWGTFELTQETSDQPPRDIASALKAQGLAADRFWLLKQGETRTLSGTQ